MKREREERERGGGRERRIMTDSNHTAMRGKCYLWFEKFSKMCFTAATELDCSCDKEKEPNRQESIPYIYI